jgi:hypothetical protein
LVAVIPGADSLAKKRLHFFLMDLVEAGLPDFAKRVLAHHGLVSLLSPTEKEHLQLRTKAPVPSLTPCWSQDTQEISKCFTACCHCKLYLKFACLHLFLFILANPRLQRGLMEESLIQSFDATEICDLITKLNSMPFGKAPCKINSRVCTTK